MSNQNDQVTAAETAELLRLAQECLSFTGDFVELGCYKGDTSVLLGKILASRPEKKLYLYDSFAGLPEKTQEDMSSAGVNFQGGELLVTKREVVDKIRHAGLKNVLVKKTWFNQLTAQDLPTEITFAFLDGDFYQSIRESLQLVTPLMNPAGIMVVHDYNNAALPGATRAVDEFLRQYQKYHLSVHHSLAILKLKN